MVTICTTSLTFNKSTFCPHSVFVCFVWISEQTAIISLYRINWLVFIAETECVYCAVRTEIMLIWFYTVKVFFYPMISDFRNNTLLFGSFPELAHFPFWLQHVDKSQYAVSVEWYQKPRYSEKTPSLCHNHHYLPVRLAQGKTGRASKLKKKVGNTV